MNLKVGRVWHPSWMNLQTKTLSDSCRFLWKFGVELRLPFDTFESLWLYKCYFVVGILKYDHISLRNWDNDAQSWLDQAGECLPLSKSRASAYIVLVPFCDKMANPRRFFHKDHKTRRNLWNFDVLVKFVAAILTEIQIHKPLGIPFITATFWNCRHFKNDYYFLSCDLYFLSQKV